MKIKDSAEIAALRTDTAREKPPAKAEAPERTGRLPEAALVALTVDGARRSAHAQRAVRLREVEASVRSGSYSPDAAQIAQKILASAELDARLQTLLR